MWISLAIVCELISWPKSWCAHGNRQADGPVALIDSGEVTALGAPNRSMPSAHLPREWPVLSDWWLVKTQASTITVERKQTAGERRL